MTNKEQQNDEVWNRFALIFSELTGSIDDLPSTFDIPCWTFDIRFFGSLPVCIPTQSMGTRKPWQYCPVLFAVLKRNLKLEIGN